MSHESLKVENLAVRFSGFSLRNVSFEVRPGTIVGFLGENGAGKSTTLKLIMGMIRKESGTARIGSRDHRQDEKAFKRRLGFVDEECFFYSKMRVGRLIDFVAGFYDEWNAAYCDELLRRLGLTKDAYAGRLSKGTKAKLGIVLALAHRPDVLLLDEPSAGLDPRSRVELFELLREVRADGRGLLFSTHNVDEVERLADTILVIHQGAIIFDGHLDELRRKAGADWSLEHFFLDLVKAHERQADLSP